MYKKTVVLLSILMLASCSIDNWKWNKIEVSESGLKIETSNWKKINLWMWEEKSGKEDFLDK